MPISILATKLFVPPPRAKIVLRPRLIERLNDGLAMGRKLTLISASAGFGKTTLVSEWVACEKRPIAWLSLDEGDNDVTRFLTYFVSALQTIAPNIGAGVLGVLQSPQPPLPESILTTLIPLDQLPKDQEIVVVCRSGNRRDILLEAGLTNVTSMAGGLNQWKTAGYPTVSGL